jgi:hypothetical protein
MTAQRWQYVFPSAVLSVDPRSGARRRHHAHEGAVSRAITTAVRAAGINKRATSHSLRSASAYYYTFQRRAYFQRNSPWSGDVLGSWRP